MEKPKQTQPKSKVAQFLEKRPVLIAFGVLSLALAYVFISWAIDSGSLLDYTIAAMLLFVGIRDLTMAFKRQK
jgi:uncharacterized membrane protein HdeD (DUF308 family)